MYINQYDDSQPDYFRIYNFGGINRLNNSHRTEFSDMYNMSADEYPCAAPRGRRKKIAEASSFINVACAPDVTNVSEITGITGVYDSGFYYDGNLKSKKYKLNPEWKWQIVQKGNVYIINGYDTVNKKSLMYYYNIDTDVFAEGGKVMRNLIVTCGDNYIQTVYNDAYGVYGYSCTTPDGTKISNSDFFEDYSEYIGTDSSGYRTMSSENNIFQQYFKVGDEITIENFPGTDNGGQVWELSSGSIIAQPNITTTRNNTIDTDNMATTDELKDTDIVRAVITRFAISAGANRKYAHEVYFKLYNKNGEEVSFRDMKTSSFYCSGVTLKKRTRVFDNIAIHQGRLWGTIPSGNQIYASASDDIFSFSSDDILNKYGARLPSDTGGSFTSICSYNNDLVCFKNNSITIISGTNPVNYNTTVINGIGCISPKSAVATPSGIIFLSYKGFYVFSGSIPYSISSKLNTTYQDAVAGSTIDTYYASATKSDGARELLKYDMSKDIWLKEDEIEASDIFQFKDKIYIADYKSLYECNNPNGDSFEWYIESVPIRNYTIDNKAVCELWILADVSEGSHFKVWTKDDHHEWRLHNAYTDTGLKVFRCPIKAKDATSYKYKISGSGKVVIHEIEIHTSEGGRRYKEQKGTASNVNCITY